MVNLKFSAPVISYVTEEVWRQHHDIDERDGIMRVGWMLNAWSLALHEAQNYTLTVGFVERLGKLIEPSKNAEGFRSVNEKNSFQSNSY